MRWLLVLVVATGCIQPALVDCGDGRACPSGTVCDAKHTSCVTPDQIAACDGALDLADCSTSRIATGVCDGGVCIARGCGNTVVEANELCDDGNRVSGDGCSATCVSREVCGDGFADSTRGEQCDDGNHANRDGCSSTCVVEDLRWVEHSFTDRNGERFGAMAYDPIRDRLVAFGGLTGDDHVHEWDGSAWLELAPETRPIARIGHAMAYDPVHRRVVMFGGTSTGINAGQLLADTWAWDGVRWERLRPTAAPPARTGVAMAWDPAIKRIVMFGGAIRDSEYLRSVGDTWLFDGEQWTLVMPPTSPSARDHHGVTFDAVRNQIVLFGGQGSGPGLQQPMGDTWTFDGTTWTRLAIPLLASLTSMIAFDAKRGQVVLVDDAVHDLSPSGWISRAAVPYVPVGGSIAYDARLGEVAVWSFDSAKPLLLFDGTAIDTPVVPARPSPRFDAAIASDPVRGRVVLFGGSSLEGDLWELDGHRWVLRGTTDKMKLEAAAMVYDGTTGEVLLFGGRDDSNALNATTYTWDGARWQDRGTAGPPGRVHPQLAFDEARRVVVLFGGDNEHDTWEWNGSTWTARGPGPDLLAPTLAYDARRAVSVALGANRSTVLPETWEWAGTSWVQRVSTQSPPPFLNALVYNRARGRVFAETSTLETWEWDGATWKLVTAIGLAPAARGNCALVYDETRREVVMFGGAVQAAFDDTWTASYTGIDEQCGSGLDADGDALFGCNDADCRAQCDPLCPDGGTCAPGRPRCGDGMCSPLENDRLCPADCATSPAICGDDYCSPGESCALDCP